MQTRIDHLVLAGPDLDGLIERVSEQLGATPEPGGAHTGLGTRNALLGLGGLRYLELVGPDPDQPDPEGPRPFGVDALTRPRLVGWAVRSPDITGLVAEARAAGYDPGDPVDMVRERSGDTLSWKVTSLDTPMSGAVPFVIDWLDTRHPSEGLPLVELVTLKLAHPRPDDVRARLLALRLRTGAPVVVAHRSKPRLTATLRTALGTVELG